LVANFTKNLHAVIVRSAAALGRDPGDDLIWVGDVTGFAVNTVRRIQADAFSVRLRGIVDHFIYVGWAEILTGTAEFLNAASVANVGVVNHQMRGLVFFVPRAGVVEVGEFVERELAIASRWTDQVTFAPAVCRQICQFLEVLVPGNGGRAIA
jgi:hypothetical protein